ncbi:COX15/CtaA family protein [Chondromyces apiculatus]|uniref:Heme A synthase, cytochrome oxidase biogenesis protein Cox15-CtaA n=1 Tax=Chondromyces apiculatus DSM 436 TaxID=1192034 RepID=A0A017T5P9_9BACT|nr:COX15/CtaA family protein [Chondromyces apiculatus]EYF04352.1 Heme A synthase, cytochrome oxidase biogenesis protein Cox15-CtaA [Chondromyces apiculatus DSM 436]
MTQERFRKLAMATLAATLAVILWGAFVRATGSGAGCGSHWPTCNGEIIPRAAATATLIEFTHRITSGIAFLLVALQFFWARKAFPSGHPARAGAAASMFFMVTEAGVGALLVLFEYVADNASVGRAVWMAVHLVNTFLLVGAMACTLWWARGGAPVRLRGQGATAALLAAALAATLLVGVTGAIAALGDTLFTARTLSEGLAQDLSPTAHFLVQLRVFHPINAALTAAYLLFLRTAIPARRPTPTVRRLANATGAVVVMQIGAGLLNLLLLAPVWLQLVHLLLADALWISLILLAAAALGAPEAAGHTPAGDPLAAVGRTG